MAQDQQISDSTVNAFLAIPDDQKRAALGKMSTEAKQALFTALQSRNQARQSAPPDETTRAALAAGVGQGVPSAPQYGRPPGIAPTPPSLLRVQSQMEEEGQRVNDYGNVDVMQHRAATSPTPVTNASAIMYPMAALRSVVATPIGAYAGREVGGLVGHPQAGQNLGALIASLLSGLGHEVGDYVKYEPASEVRLPWWMGGGRIKRNIPEAPFPEELPMKAHAEMEKDIGQGQLQRARAQQEMETAMTRKEAQATKTQNAAYEKEARENMAIQKRYDDAQAERVQAEKELKNQRFQAEQAHARELREMESARQQELAANQRLRDLEAREQAAATKADKAAQDDLQKQIDKATKDANRAAADMERLRTQHGDALMKRGKEAEQLQKRAQDALTEETAASIERTQSQVKSLKGPGIRPSTSESQLTTSVRSPVVTLEQFREEARQLGSEGVKKPGEGIMQYQARVLGLIRARRAARGMAEPKF